VIAVVVVAAVSSFRRTYGAPVGTTELPQAQMPQNVPTAVS